MTELNSTIGFEEGVTCNRNGCDGVIALAEAEGCYCHISPPCSACTALRLYCPECDWREEDDPLVRMTEGPIIYMNTDLGVPWCPKVKRVLDPTKIDYHTESHSSCSQKCTGVCPLGTSSETVRKACDGTFGGRFERWNSGKDYISFIFIAYTD